MSETGSDAGGPNQADVTGSWPVAEGELARLIRALDWSRTPLGPIDDWPQALKTTVDLMLGTQAQIVLFCGPEYVALYNDAYAPTIGDKHPRALGRPARENWSELWDDLEPLLRGVLETGKTYAAKDREFYLERSEAGGETVYFDISYSAVRGCERQVVAVLCIVTETTGRVRAMEAQQKIRESEARARALVLASSDAVYRMSADWQEMRQLDGRGFLSDTEGPSVRWQDEYLFPEDQPAVLAHIEKAIAERGVFELEHRVKRSDGSAGWTFSRAVPILDDDGRINEWFGMAADVTVLRNAREQEKLLHTELSHRMKNLFAMVQAISTQTLRRVGDRAQVQALQDRLKALSSAHDILLHNSWNEAPIEEVVEAAANSFSASERIQQYGPSFRLGPKAALSMALLLHELGTNALKHGALSVPDGRVELTWRVEAGDGTPAIHMLWAESGGPDVTEPDAHGFGSKLIQAGLGGSGSVTLRFARSGLQAEISAPLHELLAAE